MARGCPADEELKSVRRSVMSTKISIGFVLNANRCMEHSETRLRNLSVRQARCSWTGSRSCVFKNNATSALGNFHLNFA